MIDFLLACQDVCSINYKFMFLWLAYIVRGFVRFTGLFIIYKCKYRIYTMRQIMGSQNIGFMRSMIHIRLLNTTFLWRAYIIICQLSLSVFLYVIWGLILNNSTGYTQE